MSDNFVFVAQAKAMDMAEGSEKPQDSGLGLKRARSAAEVVTEPSRRQSGESFKSKLLGMSSPNSWIGFRSQRERLKIEPDDITITKDFLGEEEMHLSAGLTERLQRPWKNAKEGTSAEPFGPWLLAPVGRGRVGLGSVNRDSMNGRQNFGGICNRVGRHTGAAVNGVDEVGFKYMVRDGRYANSGAKFGSREEVRTVPNAGVSGVSKGKIGKGVDVVKGNGKVGADSRDRSEKSTNEDNGAYVSYSGGGLRFEVLDSMVEEGTPKGLIFQPKISKKNKPVLNEITNKRFATTVVPKNPMGSGKKSGKVPGSIGSKCGSIKEGISGRKNNCLGKDVSFYLKDHKLEGNGVANGMALMGQCMEKNFGLFSSPRTAVLKAVQDDLCGAVVERVRMSTHGLKKW
ncbi:hypothetical protein ACOSQ3_030729 [Xanthoceras sorbifolium]